MSHKIVVAIDVQAPVSFTRSARSAEFFEKILEIRSWCYDNIKGRWKTYFIEQAVSAMQSRNLKMFAVFEFADQKDAMLFRLYTGK